MSCCTTSPDVIFRKRPGSIRAFAVPLTAVLMGDEPLSATVLAKPSGTGELTMVDLTVTEEAATVWVGSGYPGRSYLLDLTIVGASGQVYRLAPQVLLSEDGAVYPTSQPPSEGQGEAAVWSTPDVFLTGADGSYLTGPDSAMLFGADGGDPFILGADASYLVGADGSVLTGAPS